MSPTNLIRLLKNSRYRGVIQFWDYHQLVSALFVLILGVLVGCHPAPPVLAAPKTAEEAEATTNAAPVPLTGYRPVTRSPLQKEDVPILEALDREYSHLAEAVLPSVVSLTCRKWQLAHDETFTFPIPFHGTQNVQLSPPVYGAGVLISHNGYIVTNHHVIEEASTIDVQLNDKRKFQGQLIASDEQADIAVLKIEGRDFPALPWGDSDQMHIGQQVFAAGNPFNLNDSFSNGIISAKGRNLSSFNYHDFIQTNAMINPGSSGGALVNIRGELIGINAAIASTSHVNMGIGFAIPSNLARFTVNSLIKNGKVIRGFLGVSYQPEPIAPEIREQLGLNDEDGALVNDIWPNSPADIAKLQHGDYITALDGHKITTSAELRLFISQIPIGQEVKIDFIRDEKPHQVKVKITEFTDKIRQASAIPNPLFAPKKDLPSLPAPAAMPDLKNSPVNVLRGILVAELTEPIRKHLGNLANHGVVVTGFAEITPTQNSNLEIGDVIKSAKVGHQGWIDISSVRDFLDLAQKVKSNETVLLLLAGQAHGNEGLVSLAPNP